MENFINFRIYVTLGQSGLITKFLVAPEFLEEERDWLQSYNGGLEKSKWLHEVFYEGLKILSAFLNDLVAKYGVTSEEIQQEQEDIKHLVEFYDGKHHFTETRVSVNSLGYFKAAAVCVIFQKEEEKKSIAIPRILQAKDRDIYKIVAELRKNPFPQIKMPACIHDFTEFRKSGRGQEGMLKETIGTSCGPLARESCDLLPSIGKDFSDKNVFLDIPYQPNYKVCETTLRSVLSELGFSPIAAKDKLTSNAVLCKVCRLIKTCAFGIVDISSSSNSVTYEYGLMHGLGMKVCLLLQKESEKFTDIDALEHLTYSGVHNLCIELTRWLIDNIPGVDLGKANALIDRETDAFAASGDRELPKLQPSVAKDNGLKIFLEDAEASKQYNTEMVRKIKSDFSGKKLFFMTATPIPVGQEFIDSNDEKIQKVIKSPSSNRSIGWTMSFYDPAQDMTHTFDGIEKRLGDLKLRLFRNGYLDFCAVVTDSFSWGMEDKSNKDVLLFNPYSITEYPVSFFRLLRELSTIVDGLKSFHVSMGFINCGEYALRPYGINSYGHMFGMEENMRRFDDWYFEKTFQVLVHENDSDAFVFSERVYNTFGYTSDKIPYFNGEKVFEAKE